VSGRSADPLETSLLFDVFALNQAVGRLLADAMQDGPLPPAAYAVYSAIFELEAASPTRIASRLGMRLTTCMDHLRDMTQRGHARRLPHPTDRRSYRVTLTAEGRAAHRAANERFERAHAAFDRALGADAEAAKSMLRALREAALEAQPTVDAQPRVERG
jgi:DNA-binding MarR family transcriptional regulator